MFATVRCLLLAAAAVGLVALSGATPSSAQDKSKTTVKNVGTVEIYEAKDGFRFRVKDIDGNILALPSKGFEKKEECIKALEALKATMGAAKFTEVKEKEKGK